MTLRRTLATCALALVLGGCTADDSYVAGVDAWHAEREEGLRADDGWLTLVALIPLPDGVHELGASPDSDLRLPAEAPASVGLLAVEGDDVFFAAARGVEVTLRGDPVPVSHVEMRDDAEGEPTVLVVDRFLLYVIARGGSSYLRVKDRESELLRGFTGIDRFPVDPRWRVTARLERGGDGVVRVPDVLGHEDEAPSPGTLVFDLEGVPCRLTPMGETGEDLFIVFGDATNGDGTYGGGRFLSAPAPDADGNVVLDFNKAVDPPCVFTPYATCPLPPAGNVLSVSVEAGEKMWGHGHE